LLRAYVADIDLDILPTILTTRALPLLNSTSHTTSLGLSEEIQACRFSGLRNAALITI